MAVTVISSPGLFMIFTAGRNLECAVNLFAEHDARKLVREGHRGHGKPEVGLLRIFPPRFHYVEPNEIKFSSPWDASGPARTSVPAESPPHVFI